jgi:SAM-dependent methyltransferase
MSNVNLESFYENWSDKDIASIQYDIEVSKRKAHAILSIIPFNCKNEFKSILDFGCGYGGLLHNLIGEFNQDCIGYGFDFSKTAIQYAERHYGSSRIFFNSLDGLDSLKNVHSITNIVKNKFDAILLVDLLEHVQDCKDLLRNLSKLSDKFVIKLPLEASFLDNYILPKEYPSFTHRNGHLREFDVNSVHYFIRNLGLNPIEESTYIYSARDLLPKGGICSIRKKFINYAIFLIRLVGKFLLPKKLFLKFIGGGGYICIATYDSKCEINLY